MRPSLAKRRLVTLVAALTFGAHTADASVIFDQSPSTVGEIFNGVWTSDLNGQEHYEIVPTLSGSTIFGFDYFTYDSTSPPANAQPRFTLNIRKNELGAPGLLLFSVETTTQSITPLIAGGRSDLAVVALTFSSIFLPDESLWFAVSGGLTQFSPLVGTLTGASTGDGTFRTFSPSGGYSFTNTSGDIALRLHGATSVPEPSTLALLFTGLIAALTAGNVKKRSSWSARQNRQHRVAHSDA